MLTRYGMDTVCIPHGCGGGPRGTPLLSPVIEYSPRMWGWTVRPVRRVVLHIVFPTDVGVDRSTGRDRKTSQSIPHGCGGGPLTTGWGARSRVYSPRMWGWTADNGMGSKVPGVFPTDVGVDRQSEARPTGPTRIPHGCGGGPGRELTLRPTTWYSPRMWGWTGQSFGPVPLALVFPTDVGVDRNV